MFSLEDKEREATGDGGRGWGLRSGGGDKGQVVYARSIDCQARGVI